MMGYYDSENLYSIWNINKSKFVKVRDVKFYEDKLGHPSLVRSSIKKGEDLFGKKLEIRDNRAEDELLDVDEDEWDEDHEEVVPVVAEHAAIVQRRNVDVIKHLAMVAVEEVLGNNEDGLGGLSETASGKFSTTATTKETEIFIRKLLERHGVTEAPGIADAVLEPSPTSYSEAMQSKNAKFWLFAMATEIHGLMLQSTYDLVAVPSTTTNVIPAKWVYAYKYGVDGLIIRFKARWVARGDKQRFGLDYHETFALVAKCCTLRILLMLAVQHDWEVEQMDVVIAFLYPPIDTNVYLQQPLGFRLDDTRVCKLNKSLYGLCQAARQWYNLLHSVLVVHGFIRLDADYALWSCQKGGRKVWVLVHVDDLLIVGEAASVRWTKAMLCLRFKMTDLGPISLFIGIHVVRDRKGRTIALDQHSYVEEFLKTMGLQDANPVVLPMDPKDKISTEGAEITNIREYQQGVGFLMYLMISTRPDISFAITKLAQQAAAPTSIHFAMLKRVARYVRGTAGAYLVLKASSDTGLTGYFDASHQDNLDLKLSYRYMFKFNENIVSWKSKKHIVVILLTTESEYVAGAEAVREALWLRRLLYDVGFAVRLPMVIYNDNRGCVLLSKNPEFHDRTKHIGAQCRLLTEYSSKNIVAIHQIPTSELPADMLTKPLPRDLFMKHAKSVCIVFRADAPIRGKRYRHGMW